MTDLTMKWPGKTEQDGQGRIKLVVVAGVQRGEEFAVDHEVVNIGREVENEVVLKDLAVSRRHAKIVRDGHGYRIIDSGSGNGVLMGGRRVTNEALKSGALFKIGETVLRFIAVGDVYSTDQEKCAGTGGGAAAKSPDKTVPIRMKGAAAAPQNRRPLSLLLYGSMALAVFLALAVAVKYTLLPGDEGASGRGQAVEASQKHDALWRQQLFEQGVEAFKKQDWKTAGYRFSELLSVDPSNESARTYRDKVAQESASREALEKARELLAQGKADGAAEQLKKIPGDSHYSTEAAAMAERAKAAAEAAKAQEMSEDTVQRQPRVERRASPGNGERPRRGGRNSEKTEKGREAAAEPAVPADQGARASQFKGGPVTDKVTALFKKGDIAGAMEFVETEMPGSDPAMDRLLAEMKSFQSAYKEGEGYWKSKQDEGAVRALSRALQSAKAIAPVDNVFIPKISSMLADMYFLRGMKAFYKDNFLLAVQNFQTALKYKPDHQQSQAKLGEVANAAQRLFEEAYVLKSADPEAAKRKFELIIQLTPPTNDYHKKAREWVKKL